MKDEISGNVIVFNGEIYNHLALRQELQASGVNFRGHSDTETLLKGYYQWGNRVFSKLKGMFAVALYDHHKQALVIVRDRFGIKPLYYTKSQEGLYFASELRALRALSQVIKKPKATAIASYLQTGSCPGSSILFPDIHELPPATLMSVDIATITTTQSSFWQAPVTQLASTSPGDASITLRRLLEASVQEHLLADVPVASLLSGGIDSSIITALAAKYSSSQVATFSVGFAERDFDESPYARLISKKFHTNHTHIQLTEDEVLQDVVEAVGSMDLPSTDGINTYIVSKQVARAGYKVALSGLGADELFGGYSFFYDLPRLRYLAYVPDWLKTFVRKTGKGRHMLTGLPEKPDVADFTWWWRRCLGVNELQLLGLDAFKYPKSSISGEQDAFARISLTEIDGYLRHTLLRDSDCMSMAVSLELRVPFLDHEIVNFALSLRGNLKGTVNLPKSLLVKSCSDLLPPEIYTRRKMGFVLPMQRWMRGPLLPFCNEGLQHLVNSEVFSDIKLNTLSAQLRNANQEWPKLWALVVLGHYWHRNIARMPR
jgi:asparagine synthase (glutamine-hydrolysing)